MKMRFLALMGLALIFSSCSLKNKIDAILASDSSNTMSHVSGEPGTAITRTSGGALLLRMQKLFPSMTGDDVLNPNHFNQLTASGLSVSLAQDNRPAGALAQVALRQDATFLCSNANITGNTAQNSIFSTTGILLTGESFPADAVTKKVFAAVRNAWLLPVSASAPEVATLVKMYQDIQKASTQAEADRSLCISVLLAPQFLFGMNHKAEPMRKVALELGRRLPTFSEYDAFINGRMKIEDYVRQIQQEPGYISAVKEFHRVWLGLAPVFDTSSPMDIRSDSHATDNTFSQLVGTHTFVSSATFNENRKLIVNDSHARYEACNLKNSDGSTNIQPFDPRTWMMVWEVKNPLRNRWEIAAAFVHEKALGSFSALIGQYYSNPAEVLGECVKESENEALNGSIRRQSPYFNPANAPNIRPEYYRCGGRVENAAQTGFEKTSFEDFLYTNVVLDANKKFIPNEYQFTEKSALSRTVVQIGMQYDWYDPRNTIRYRRFAPSMVEQTGVSVVKSWYTGEEYYVCNNVTRFVSSCSFRPHDGAEHGPNSWKWSADYGWSPANHWVKNGTWIENPVSPLILNEMRCGIPKPELVYGTTLLTDYNAYPYGYDFSTTHYSDPVTPDQSQLNPIANQIAFWGGSSLEAEAIKRMKQDLQDEPINLIGYILQNSKPYTDLVNGRYTIGREELEFLYKTQAYYLPKYPSGVTVSAPDDPKRKDYRVINFSTMAPLSTSYITNYPALKVSMLTRGRTWTTDPTLTTDTHEDAIPPKPASGILTMPAFTTPVGKARTFSDRIYERLMCGLPGQFTLSSDQTAVHEKYMLDPANPATSHTGALHLDKKKPCYQCHINLDPLASAMSPNFLRYVQENEGLALSGENLSIYNPNVITAWSLRYDSKGKGKGAFLGREVSGIQAVGDTLAQSDQFLNCATQKAFQFVFGRQVGSQDLTEFNRFMSDFKKSNYNYNDLIVDMVKSKTYQGDQ